METEGSLPCSKELLDHILRQIKPIHILAPLIFKVYFNINGSSHCKKKISQVLRDYNFDLLMCFKKHYL
jgi:hypothetical protein